jgi:putative membrane protein
MSKISRATAFIFLLTSLCAAATAQSFRPPPPAAEDFALMAAQSDEYEIQAGQDAVIQAVDPRVRAFAEQMISDHAKSGLTLRRAAAESHLQPPPPALSSDQAMLLGALQSLRGSQFDRTYMRQQVLAHSQAFSVAQNYAQNGSDTNLRSLAQSALTTVQHHADMARTLSHDLDGS